VICCMHDLRQCPPLCHMVCLRHCSPLWCHDCPPPFGLTIVPTCGFTIGSPHPSGLTIAPLLWFHDSPPPLMVARLSPFWFHGHPPLWFHASFWALRCLLCSLCRVARRARSWWLECKQWTEGRKLAISYRLVLPGGSLWVYDPDGDVLITVNEHLLGDWGKPLPLGSTACGRVLDCKGKFLDFDGTGPHKTIGPELALMGQHQLRFSASAAVARSLSLKPRRATVSLQAVTPVFYLFLLSRPLSLSLSLSLSLYLIPSLFS
jgi:hypothetical protein